MLLLIQCAQKPRGCARIQTARYAPLGFDHQHHNKHFPLSVCLSPPFSLSLCWRDDSRRKRKQARVGAPHRNSRDETMKWFQQKVRSCDCTQCCVACFAASLHVFALAYLFPFTHAHSHTRAICSFSLLIVCVCAVRWRSERWQAQERLAKPPPQEEEEVNSFSLSPRSLEITARMWFDVLALACSTCVPVCALLFELTLLHHC